MSSYFNNLQDEEYQAPRYRGRNRRDSYRSDTSQSASEEPDRDSRDYAQRPLSNSRGGDNDSSSRASSSYNNNQHRKKKKKKDKSRLMTQYSIPESAPLVPTEVVRNESQTESSMASESYTQRSTALSFGSSSSNIMEAYRKLKETNRTRSSVTGSTSVSTGLPRHSEHEHESSTNTQDTRSRSQQTPATSTSTQDTTTDDEYNNNNNSRSKHKHKHHKEHKSHKRSTTKGSSSMPASAKLVPEYPPVPTQPQTTQVYHVRVKEQTPEFPPPEQAPPQPTTSRRASTTKTKKKQPRPTGVPPVPVETVQMLSMDMSESQQVHSSAPPPPPPPRTATATRDGTYNREPSNRRQQAADGIPVPQVYAQQQQQQQVYSSYGRDNPMQSNTAPPPPNNPNPPMAQAQPYPNRNSARQSPIPGAHAVLARNMAIAGSNRNLNQSNHTSAQQQQQYSPVPNTPHTMSKKSVTIQADQNPPPMTPRTPRRVAGGGPPRSITTSQVTQQVDNRDRGSLYSISDPLPEDDTSFDASGYQQNNRPPVHMRQALDNSELDPTLSRQMGNVRDNLRRQMTNPPTTLTDTPKSSRRKKSRKSSKRAKDDQSDASSSSSSSSGGHGILGFLSGFKGHPKSDMTASERRAAQNPFLNRPQNVKTFNTIGHFGEQQQKKKKRGDDSSSDSSHDHQRRRADDSDGDESYTSYSSESTKARFPLPAPLRKVQQLCGQVVTNTQFQVFMICLIMLNAAVLGIATYTFDNPKVPEALDIIDRILLVIFTIELALQFGYCGYNLFLDGWLVFDTLTVVTSWWLEGVQVFRSFRIFRSFRLIVRLPLLKNLVLTVFHVMPRIYSILCLLLLVLYVFGVLTTILYGYQEWGDKEEDKVDYFGHLGLSIFTLFQMVTLEGWGEVVRLVAAEHQYSASLIFSVFIVITGFIMYNLIVAVMCDSMLVIEAQGREELREQQKERKILDEIAKQEEEKRMHDEMLAQRKIDGGGRERIKGLVNDDPTVAGSAEDTQQSELSSAQLSLTEETEEEEEEEEYIEMRPVMCPNCEHCHEIPKFTWSYRNKTLQREANMERNQERINYLMEQVESLADTQIRVTNVLQTLMYEIESSRVGNVTSDGDTFNLSTADFSLEDYQKDFSKSSREVWSDEMVG